MLFTPDSLKAVAEPSTDLSVAGGNGSHSVNCLTMTPLGHVLAASSSGSNAVRVFDSKSLVDLSRVPPRAEVVARIPMAAFRRLSPEQLARLCTAAKARLPPGALSRLAREARVGIPQAVFIESVKVLGVLRQRWPPRLPLGVLHRLPPSDRSACIAFLGAR